MYRLGWWVLGLTLVLALCFSRMEGVPSGATTPFLFTGLLALGLAEYHHRRAQGSHYDQAAAAVILPQYKDMVGYDPQRAVLVRRMYQDLKGTLR